VREVDREETPHDDVEHRPPDRVDDAIEVAPRLIDMAHDDGVDAM